MIKGGADVNSRDDDGKTTLICLKEKIIYSKELIIKYTEKRLNVALPDIPALNKLESILLHAGAK
jgi:hypothetical protein